MSISNPSSAATSFTFSMICSWGPAVTPITSRFSSSGLPVPASVLQPTRATSKSALISTGIPTLFMSTHPLQRISMRITGIMATARQRRRSRSVHPLEGNRTGKEAPRAFLRSGPLKGREPLNPEDEAGHSFLAFSPSDLSHEKCPSERQRGMWITASSRLSYLSKRIHCFAGIITFLASARRLQGFIVPVPPPTLDKIVVSLFTCYSHQKTFTLLYGIRNLPSTDGTIGFPDPRRTEDPGGPQPFPSVVSPKKVHRAASLFSQRN